MKLKSIMAAVAAGVALASPLAASAYTYNDGTYKWGFYTYENENKEQVASLMSVSRVDGQKISGAFVFPATVSVTVTNELGYSKYDETTERYSWVQTRAPKAETLTLPVEEIGWDGFYYGEDYDWQSDPLITSVTIPEGVKFVYGLVGACLTNVTAVTFPSTVKYINSCFGFCDKLASVSVPEDAYIDSAFIGTAWAKAMGDFFVWNGNLIRYQGTATEVVVPEGVETLGTAAFAPYYWEGFTEESWEMFASATNITKVTLPSSLGMIGTSAFDGCEKLAAIDIPNGVYAIGDDAFWGTALTAITLPKWLGSLGSSAFAYTAISSLAIPEVMQYLSSTCAYMTNLTAVTIPSRAKYLSYTFNGCSKLMAIDIPAKVEEIGYGTFQGCKALTSVTGGAGLKSVNSSAFGYESTYWDSEKGQYVSSGTGVPFYDNAPDGFRVLGPVVYGYKGKCAETLTVPAGVKYVMSSVIPYNSDKSAVKTITLSDGVETVSYSAFSYCDNLETVNLGNTVTNLGNSAFYQSGRYEYDEDLGYSVYKPGKLATVTGGAAIEVGRDAFYGTQFMQDKAMLAGNDGPFGLIRLGKSVLGYKGKFAAGEFNIPADVTEFGLYGWDGSTTNVTALTGGASLKGYLGLADFEKLQRADVEGAIEEFDCWGMAELTDVNLPNAKLSGIYEEAFNDCFNLANVTVGLDPEAAEYGWAEISGAAFMGCDNLKSVNVLCPGFRMTGYKANTGVEDEDFPNDLSTFKYIGYRTDFSVYEDGDAVWNSLYLRPQFVKPYTVVFNANGGSGSMAKQDFLYGEEKMLSRNAFTRAGYEFLGWAFCADVDDIDFEDEEWVMDLTDELDGVVTLYAVWEKIEDEEEEEDDEEEEEPLTVSITFHSNDSHNWNFGFGGFEVGKALGTPSGLTSITGQAGFLGWFTAAAGGSQVTAGTIVTAGLTDLYAHWSTPAPAPAPVVDDGKGQGSGMTPDERKAEYEKQQKVKNDPERTIFSIDYDLGGGVNAAENPTAYSSVAGLPLTLAAPTREGYLFKGWSPNGGVIAVGTKGDLRFTAMWAVILPSEPVVVEKAKILSGCVMSWGEVVGTVQVKLGKQKQDKATGVRSTKLSVVVTGMDGKKKTSSSTSIDLFDDRASRAEVEVKDWGKMSITIAGDKFSGMLGEYDVQSDAIGGDWTAADAGATVIPDDSIDLIPGDVQDWLLPYDEPVIAKKGKWSFAKAASVKWAKDKETGDYDLIVDDKKGKNTNYSGLKLTYMPKTGAFKGSFKLYSLEESSSGKTKLKKYTVNVSGAVVGGVGYGSAVLKKFDCKWPVRVE